MAIDPRVLSALIGFGGDVLSGIGEGKMSEEERALQRQRMIAQFLMSDLEGGPFRDNDLVTKERIRRDLLGNAQNVSIAAPADIAPYVPQISGGMRIPTGGLDVSALSEENLQAALADEDRKRADILAVLQGKSPLLGQQEEKKKGGGFWSKFGKVLGFAAPIAASFIPGVGPLLGAAISGGAGAASTKLQGGSWGDALKSGGLSAGMSYGSSNLFKMPRPSAAPRMPTNFTPTMNERLIQDVLLGGGVR